MVYVYGITKICSNTTYNQNINELNTPSTHDLEPTQIYDNHILTQFNPINKIILVPHCKTRSKRGSMWVKNVELKEGFLSLKNIFLNLYWILHFEIDTKLYSITRLKLKAIQ
jgi:hypothetical protein